MAAASRKPHTSLTDPSSRKLMNAKITAKYAKAAWACSHLAAVLVVVHMDRGEKTRLIAVPKVNRRERQVFYDYLATRNSACLRPKRVCICAWIMKASPPPIPFDPQS